MNLPMKREPKRSYLQWTCRTDEELDEIIRGLKEKGVNVPEFFRSVMKAEGRAALRQLK